MKYTIILPPLVAILTAASVPSTNSDASGVVARHEGHHDDTTKLDLVDVVARRENQEDQDSDPETNNVTARHSQGDDDHDTSEGDEDDVQGLEKRRRRGGSRGRVGTYHGGHNNTHISGASALLSLDFLDSSLLGWWGLVSVPSMCESESVDDLLIIGSFYGNHRPRI
ncbi:hypothetical protein MYCTH_2303278 [Thermothelomyces thermophilus ATCC 42464]|uniref:Uncharacterized protein n=1 Tax=Thermothelomyces thermophilus (strain ATCC 42464 / BCRC 31852 / DSM 1799) TaxID=573729 RepID=G2QCC5_THET4|nr:uncharacterized protein MYCTH_2303278 [Thermothelomyces thermophilus ATCC 42464]AEO57300.1 hypothetical protein MYCTH_2303278 [Thermothelomyces thermophilus ATCC 42464]